MAKFDSLYMICEKFFDEFNLFMGLVKELSLFKPTVEEINANSLKQYLEWLNFLWTEYAFLYNGTATSAYRKVKSEGLFYDDRIPIKNEMAKLKNAEKDAKKKSIFKSMLEGIKVRFDSIAEDIDTCQRELKESADFIYSRVIEKERKSTKSSKFKFSRKLHSSNIPYTLEIYINSEKIEFDIECPGVTCNSVSLQMVQHEWYPRRHYVKEPSKKKTKGNSRQAIASVAAKAPTSVAAKAPTSVAASEEAPAPAAKTPVSTKKRKLIVLSQESESKSESPKSPNLPLIEEAVVITTSATAGISNAQAPAPRRKKVVVLSPQDKYSHSKLSSAVIDEAIVPTSSPDKGLHAHELSRYQFHNERVHSLLAITDLSDHKESFINVVRDMFAQEEKHCRRSHNYIRQLIHQMVVNNWSFLGFLLHFEKAAFQIKDEIKVEVSSLVPYDSRKSARDSLQKKTRRKVNSICVQVMELFKNYAASGDDTHLQSVAIASLWSAMTITDEEMTGMKTLLSQCIANVTAEESLFLDLSGEGCISLREETFLAIAESGGELERLFRSNQREASIKHLEDLIGVRVEKEFSFKSEVAIARSLRILEDFYESPFRRIGTLVTVPHQSLSSGTMECYDGVAAVPVPPLVAIESAPATYVENPINVLMDDMAVLALEPVPFDKETRLRKTKGVVVVVGKRSGGGGGGGGKRRQSKKKKVEDKESVLSGKEEESDQELPQQEESDKEEESDSDEEKLDCSNENSMDVSETQEDKPVAVSDSNFFDKDDENSVNSEIAVRPFFPDHDPDSDDVYYKEDVVVEAESSVIAAPSFNDWKEMLDWIYDTLKEDFSLDEIIEALDSLEVFDAVTDLTEDDDKTSSALSSNNDKVSSSTPIVSVDETLPSAIITPLVGNKPIVGITSQTSSTLSSNTDKLSSPTPIVSVEYWRPIDASLNPMEKERRLRKLLTTIGNMDVLLLQILYFVHPHLHYLVKEILSTRYKPKPVECKCNEKICECPPPEVLILPRPKAIPIDLFVRASLYRDPKVLMCKCKLVKCECGKLPMPQEMPIDLYVQANQDLVFLECLKNVRWCIDHFLWYINAYPTHAANFQKWPKCEDAYVDAKNVDSPLLLMWARKNRCSCIYNFKPVPRRSPEEKKEIDEKGSELEQRNLSLDERVSVRAIRNLSLDERFALTWLEDNQARNWLPRFRYAFDIPIKFNPQRRWRCLWTTWLDDREPDTSAADRQADLDEDDIVEYMDITNAVDFETNVVPKEVIESVARMLATSVRVSNTSLDSSITIWTYENELNSIVTDKQVIISPTFIYRHQVTVALTVLAHAIRMEILQNDDVANCRNWLSFIHSIECKNQRQYDAIQTHYSRLCKNNNNIIQLLMDRCPAVQLDLFSEEFIQKFEIRLTANDQRADINLKVQRALLTAKADTRLYVCEIFESTSSSRAADLYLPLLIRKDNICLQNVATIYEKGSDRSLLFRLITRSRIGLCDNKYVWCEYSWNSISSGAFGIQKPVAVPENGEIFPCKLGRDHKLIACVYIPTKTQHIPQDCHSAMKLSESEDLVRKNWAVKDCLSIDPSSDYPLTKRVLHKMAGDLMTKYSYYQSNQHFLVSDTLVDELNSFEVNLSQSKSASVNYPPSSSSSSSSSTSIQFSNELIQLKEFLTQGDKHGCVHLLISYKKSEERGCSSWVYAYFLLHTRELVIMTRRCDNVRDIMNIGACLKRFISIALPSVPSIPIAQVPSIRIAQVLWRSRTLCDRELSGYYAFKQFWKHAEIIRSSITTKKSKAFSETYTSKIKDYDPDEYTKFPSWGLLEITGKQVVQLIKDIRAELFPSKPSKPKKANSDPDEKFYVQDFLLKQ